MDRDLHPDVVLMDINMPDPDGNDLNGIEAVVIGAIDHLRHDTDIIVASAKAYLSALNKMLVSMGHFGPVEIAATETVKPA